MFAFLLNPTFLISDKRIERVCRTSAILALYQRWVCFTYFLHSYSSAYFYKIRKSHDHKGYSSSRPKSDFDKDEILIIIASKIILFLEGFEILPWRTFSFDYSTRWPFLNQFIKIMYCFYSKLYFKTNSTSFFNFPRQWRSLIKINKPILSFSFQDFCRIDCRP